MKTCAIIAAMPMEKINDFLPKDCFVIAVDAGYEVAVQNKIVPNILIGDWDSCKMPNVPVETITLPKEKDDTDTYFAAKWAIKNSFKNILIFGALGGRLDHSFANLQTLLYIKKCGINCTLYGQGAVANMIFDNEKIELVPNKNFCFSLFAFDCDVTGVSIENAKYPLTEA
ncbi:MAG: thiamine diphosphokinase, partial [Oscillospiraceae bacterium]